MGYRVGWISRTIKTLGSARFAAWLIAVLSGYLVLGSIFPQRDLDRAAYETWANANPTLSSVTEFVGLDAPFVHPVFFILAAVITLSTAICSVHRTKRAIRIFQSVGKVSDAKVSAVVQRPHRRYEIPASDVRECYERSVEALAGARLKVSRGSKASMGTSGAWGLFGSPVFHWSLVALFVVISAGMLTRSEGLLGIVEGFQRQDVEESYGLLQRGPLHGQLSGMTIGIEEGMPLRHVVDGIDRGPAPEVYLLDGQRELARSRVYPNHPLRYSTYLIHLADFGLGIVTTIIEDGGKQASSQVFIDRDPANPTQ